MAPKFDRQPLHITRPATVQRKRRATQRAGVGGAEAGLVQRGDRPGDH